MKQVTTRELRQRQDSLLNQVREGESFEIVEGGQPVALLLPVPENPRERLIAEGKLIPGKGRLEDLGPPLPPRAGEPTLSEILEEMRRDER